MSEFKGPGSVATDSEVGHTELPDESGEVSEQEVVEDDSAAKILSIAEQLEATSVAKQNSLHDVQYSTGAERDRAIEKYNQNLDKTRELTDRLHAMQRDMKKDGWIFSRDGNSAFQVKIETNKDGKKLFRINDAYGDTPIHKGQAFPAYVSHAHTIPESVRDKIMESFTFDGDGAKELYINVPETE